jgi:Kef-type K+ transport system membrane component KefB
MNEIVSLGMILLLALLAGHLVQILHLPEVTGYILAGIVLGPSVLGWVSAENLQALQVFSEVALGLILFAIGSVFEYRLLLRFGLRVLWLTLAESALASFLVAAGMLMLGQSWQVSFLLGAIAIATAPASTLMVLRECNARGPLSDTLMGIIAVNNICCIIAFSLVASAIDLTAGWSGFGELLPTLYQAIFPLFWQLLGSSALGFLVGLMLASWSKHVVETGEMLILLAGSILLCVGVARWFGLSPLVASLAVGATMVNLSRHSRKLFDTLGGTDPPFYAIFFVLVGADLDVSSVVDMGMLGVIYLTGRSAGKFLGARLGSRILNLDANVQRYLGYGLMAQAGLAIGLMLSVEQRYPEYYPVLHAVILSSVTLFEMFGPVSARFAIVKAGESNVRSVDSGSIWSLE